MKRTILLIVLFLLGTGMIFSQENVDHIFYKGNILYSEGKYGEALKNYLQIYAQGLESAELLYNIGNCYFKIGDIGRAVLFYERARRINPRDPELRFNMEYIQSLLKDEIDWHSKFFLWNKFSEIYARFPLRIWGVMGTIVWVILIILFYVGIWRRVFFIVGWYKYSIIILTSILLFILGGVIFWKKELRSNKAVVIPDKIVVRYGPGEGEVEALILHAGSVVKMRDIKNGWCRIQLPDGKSGWTKKSSVELI